MKMSEIKELSDEQLVHHELQLERELIDSRIKKSFNTLTDSSMFGKMRKDIARIQTEITLREKKQELHKNALKAKFRRTFVPAQGDDAVQEDVLKSIADKLS